MLVAQGIIPASTKPTKDNLPKATETFRNLRDSLFSKVQKNQGLTADEVRKMFMDLQNNNAGNDSTVMNWVKDNSLSKVETKAY